MQKQDKARQVPEIVRRNVKQVIQILSNKGLQYEDILLNQYLNGEKSQYQFLLPKSKNYRYYTQQLSSLLNQPKQRKYPSQQIPQQYFQSEQIQQASPQQMQVISIVGTVQEISVGAMCQLIKQLSQSKQPYQPIENEVYQQQICVNLSDEALNKKIQPIMELVNNLKYPNRLKEGIKPLQIYSVSTKNDFLRSQFGTQRDGSMGGWGGKKYEGLGMRDQFSNYRKQASKNFYHSNIR